MRYALALVIAALIFGWFSGQSTPSRSVATIPDVSWPNCELSNPPASPVGIVGINGGLAFRPNPCLAKEIGWFKTASVYLNTGFPGPERAAKFASYPKQCSVTNEMCIAYNYGYNAGRSSAGYALQQGVIANRWWLDVETENSWSDNAMINRSVLQGMLDFIGRFAGRDRVGVYAYPGQWDLITQGWRNKLPTWVATGSRLESEATLACGSPSFTGGPVIMAQFVPRLDQNVVCVGN